MGEVVFIEVLDRSGEVRERYAVAGFPVTVGRGYDNDVILDDPYIAPHHLRIERTASGELSASDLGTANGLYVLDPPRRLASTIIRSETRLRIGHTQLRVRSRDFPVPPELQNRGRSLIRSRWAFAALLATLIALVLVDQYLGTPEKIEPLKLTILPLLTVALVAVWVGAWSFTGRLVTRHANMRAHANVILLGLIALLAVSTATEYSAFAFSVRLFEEVMLVLVAAILALVLFRHLKLVSRQSPRRLALIAASVAFCSVGGGTLVSRAASSEDLSLLRYMRYLKPPAFRLVPGKTPEAFFARMGTLKPRIDRQAVED